MGIGVHECRSPPPGLGDEATLVRVLKVLCCRNLAFLTKLQFPEVGLNYLVYCPDLPTELSLYQIVTSNFYSDPFFITQLLRGKVQSKMAAAITDSFRLDSSTAIFVIQFKAFH